jgi:hypothetical protein
VSLNHHLIIGEPCFDKRPRRKTRIDLYEPKIALVERTVRPGKRSIKKRRLNQGNRKKHDPISRVGENFAAGNVKKGRLTVGHTGKAVLLRLLLTVDSLILDTNLVFSIMERVRHRLELLVVSYLLRGQFNSYLTRIAAS